MQAQHELSPYAEATAPSEQQGYGMEAAGQEQMMGMDDHAHKKKSVLGKVKDKAKKLTTKIKKPKSPGSAGNGDKSSSSEDEDGSDHNQQLGNQFGGENEEGIAPGHGLQGETLEAIPDPHVGIMQAGVHERFRQMNIGGQTDNKLQEEVPSAPAAGVAPYLAAHDFGESPHTKPTNESRAIPVEEEGKNVEGKDLLGIPTSAGYEDAAAMDYEKPLSDKTDEVAKTTDNASAQYTPSENVSETEQAQQQKPLEDRLSEGMGAAKDPVTGAAAGAGAMGVTSASDEGDNRDMSGGKKSMLEQAKEKIFGSSKSMNEGSQRPSAAGDEQLQKAGKSKQTITDRAAGTVVSLKDTLASKLGYGAKSPTSEGTAQGEAMAMETDKASNQDDQSSKSVLQKLQDSAAGATGAVASKLGYGEQQKTHQELGDNTETNDNEKSYLQKMQQTAHEAKDAVASKLGYVSSSPTRDVKDVNLNQGTDPEKKSYMQKMQETAVGAKDAVASKLGYTHSSSSDREFPASSGTNLGVTESAYRDDENAPANTTARFHPGEEERALSQLITEKMSIGAATVKDTFLKPFGSSKSSPSTPTTMPPPPAAPTVAADKADNIVVSANDDTNTGVNTPHAISGEEETGIVGKVSGAVSSLLGTSASAAAKERENEAAGKADEDTNAAGVCTVEMH